MIKKENYKKTNKKTIINFKIIINQVLIDWKILS